jgi:PA14 domain
MSRVGLWVVFGVTVLVGPLLAAPAAAGGSAARAVAVVPDSAGHCPRAYPTGFFRACYFRGTRPGHGFLGAVDEQPVGTPAPDRAFGLDHRWGYGPVFGGIVPSAGPGNDVSAIWRGRLLFHGGNYHVTVWASDGVRLRVDGRQVLSEWRQQDARFGVALRLSGGYHRVEVAWFAAGRSGEQPRMQLHWDRLPAVATGTAARPVVEVFLIPQQDVCIAGDPWTSGPQVVVHNADGSTERAWQVDDDRDLPRALVPSDPTLSQFSQVECFSFGFSRTELRRIRGQVAGFAELTRSWSFGAIDPVVRIHDVSGEIRLHRIGTGFWISPGFLEDRAAPFMSRSSDFAISISSSHDLNTGRYYDIFACGGALGADHGMWGTGYAWVPCYDSLVILHEWEHMLTFAVDHLVGLTPIYPDRVRWPQTGFPPCGQGEPDIFRWFPDSEDWGVEPDSPWCGFTADQAGIAEMHLFAHFDPTLAHYPLGRLTGNHCTDGMLDYGETEVDQGGNCPAQ